MKKTAPAAADSRRRFLADAVKGSLAFLALPQLAHSATQPLAPAHPLALTPPFAPPSIKPDHLIRSTPENMVWGYYGADVPPIATVKDGDVVSIQAVNMAGISRKDPTAFFTSNKLPIDEQAQDMLDIIQRVKPEPSGLTGHMLTGPIYIEGADSGDTLEVRILDVSPRSSYGVNAVWPKGGDLPDAVTQAETFVYRYDLKKQTASFKPGIERPMHPFFGVMAASPPAETGRISSIPPGFYGGNLDCKDLVKGATLYLPVSVKGCLFTAGDSHAAQGNGEISGVAIEASMTLTAKFIVHKGKTIKQVRAETPTHFIAFGLDPDLNKAMRNASMEACNFLKEELGYSFNEALSICSTGVNFEVTQAVDKTLGVHAMIPKSIFTGRKFEYWKS
ncbi:MAG: acetamidase/formamidase family protein [Bacteroidota bacterium]|nr:acetamidase/formamidase family protein [Bacteroidota bacterium]